jgi:hypothetical protein
VTHTDLRDEGAHVFDLALAKGLDTGRYTLRTDPDDPENTSIGRGPNIDQPPTGTQHEVWGQTAIDQLLHR